MKSVLVYDISRMWVSRNLLAVKFVEDILESAIWQAIFIHILYLTQNNQSINVCMFIEWINEYMPENGIFSYKHTCSTWNFFEIGKSNYNVLWFQLLVVVLQKLIVIKG